MRAADQLLFCFFKVVTLSYKGVLYNLCLFWGRG